MVEEYDLTQRHDPKFDPGRPAVKNPYSMLPNDTGDGCVVNLIDDPLSRDICNLFDGCYALLMQMLGRLLLHTGESEGQLTRLADVTVGLMMDVIGPLGDALTTLPAGPSHPGLTAGPSFRLSRDAITPPHQAAAWALFIERLREMSAYCGFLEARGSDVLRAASSKGVPGPVCRATQRIVISVPDTTGRNSLYKPGVAVPEALC